MATCMLALAITVLQAGAPASPPSAPPVLARVAVIGASASAGYNARLTLAEALDAQIMVAHEPVKSFAEEALFLDPASAGRGQVERARAWSPTLVVAVDFLFWFGYGQADGEAERLQDLELGLELLDSFRCPLLVSHFPDMRPALGKMLHASQVPAPETLRKLNLRLDAWARARGGVAFVPLPELLEKLRGGEALRIGGLELQGPASLRRMIQPDELHPTAEGLGVLGRLSLDAACDERIGAKASEIRRDLVPILEQLRARSAAPPAPPTKRAVPAGQR